MAEVTQELMYELFKRLHAEIASVKDGQREIQAEMNAFRGSSVAVHQDLLNIHTTLIGHEQRLDRIENRLELRELAEAAQTRYEPHP
jgi:predicted  nucleic acid-binding Zn-ribbon protein